MRNKPRWIIGGSLALAAGAIATVAAVPALAQQSGGQHRPTTVTHVRAAASGSTPPGTPKFKAVTAAKSGGTGVVGGQSGQASADCGVTVTPVTAASPSISNAIPAKAKPLTTPVKICGPSGTTQAATGVTVAPVKGAPSNAIPATATALKPVPATIGQGEATGASPS
jgi:hypothetical protein